MKRKAIFILLLSFFIGLMTACSSNDSIGNAKMDSTVRSDEVGVKKELDNSMVEGSADEGSEMIATNRMIIHKAQLQLNVKSFEKARLSIEKKVSKYGGYIVESNVYRENEKSVNGRMTVRIPEEYFQSFLTDAEGEAADILERIVTGEDITEQYVDLESRMKSKRVVEERLLEFMGNAEKTEDLLKISSDLAGVQEEIEIIVGQMNYLKNQTSYSTIEITMYENQVIVPGVDGKKLDTWAKTKKQLASSTNSLLATGSGLVVFVIGNLPITILLVLVGAGTYFFVKKKRKKK
ncbi:DUF4349 domain-containing protein [Sporosarcina sp. G11-34]|uniref:DUF4349 domain-containing protein n=1 Tax=Sporosarcina sp. G11-34 TaxID=2849605 RepID=UPI0022A960C2|nr:DUF4349 domain-containing protein [Sporosarcina sp. G11-34]MCZ2258298.1 DUF4349 domain-containing protein [Sporosarcina sp. G11-34]